MADRALFIGFGSPVRGREERAVEVFNEFAAMLDRLVNEGRIAGAEPCLLDPHGGDLDGFVMVRGTAEQCAALPNDEDFRAAMTDASLVVENLGAVQAVTGEGVDREMGLYLEAVKKVGAGGHARAGG
jgi:hypothetical protein